MKKTTAFLAVSAATSLAGLLPAGMANAASVSCTAGTAATPVICDIAVGNYLAKAISWTGSNAVLMNYENLTEGFAVCAANIGGSQAYGLSTHGGSVETITASTDVVTAPDASLASSGCS